MVALWPSGRRRDGDVAVGQGVGIVAVSDTDGKVL